MASVISVCRPGLILKLQLLWPLQHRLQCEQTVSIERQPAAAVKGPMGADACFLIDSRNGEPRTKASVMILPWAPTSTMHILFWRHLKNQMDTHEFMISQSSYRQSYLAIQFLSHSHSSNKSLMDMDNKQKVINI